MASTTTTLVVPGARPSQVINGWTQSAVITAPDDILLQLASFVQRYAQVTKCRGFEQTKLPFQFINDMQCGTFFRALRDLRFAVHDGYEDHLRVLLRVFHPIMVLICNRLPLYVNGPHLLCYYQWLADSHPADIWRLMTTMVRHAIVGRRSGPDKTSVEHLLHIVPMKEREKMEGTPQYFIAEEVHQRRIRQDGPALTLRRGEISRLTTQCLTEALDDNDNKPYHGLLLSLLSSTTIEGTNVVQFHHVAAAVQRFKQFQCSEAERFQQAFRNALLTCIRKMMMTLKAQGRQVSISYPDQVHDMSHLVDVLNMLYSVGG